MRLFPGKKTNTLSDEELLEAYRSKGDKAFVGELYSRYAHLVYGVCLKYFKDREEARDAVLQIFEKMFDALKNNRPENFLSWLHFVSRNYCISALRKQQTIQDRAENFGSEERDWLNLDHEEDRKLREERLMRLEEALKQLGDDQRQCLELFYFSEKSYEEIAAITGFSEKQVKSHLQNGKRNLKIILGLAS
ncbi:MAG: sigma-70 family RNA polymerase sigma factor [Bacteroidia bacterium]